MRKVLVTGATKGIGRAIAQKYKQQGWKVFGTGSSHINLANESYNYLDHYLAADLSDLDHIEVLAKHIQNQKFDTLINNAGINIINNFLDISSKDFLNIHRINVYAPFKLCQAAIPYMLENKWGRIVNISSVWGKKSKQGRASYSSSKFGLDGLTLAMNNEFAKDNVLCNCVAPGFIDTEMTWRNLGMPGVQKILENVPQNRLAKVEEVAGLVYMLGSDQNTYIAGQNISIDGGFSRA